MSALLSPLDRSFVGEPVQPSSTTDPSPGSAAEGDQISDEVVAECAQHCHENLAQLPDSEANLFRFDTLSSSSLPSTGTTAAAAAVKRNGHYHHHHHQMRLLSSMHVLSQVFQKIRKREFLSFIVDRPSAGHVPNFELNMFVSRREYDNGRCLLMRNLRTIPSLCKLVSASNLLPNASTLNAKL